MSSNQSVSGKHGGNMVSVCNSEQERKKSLVFLEFLMKIHWQFSTDLSNKWGGKDCFPSYKNFCVKFMNSLPHNPKF